MDRIESRLNTNSDEFRRNRDAMDTLVKRLRDEIERGDDDDPDKEDADDQQHHEKRVPGGQFGLADPPELPEHPLHPLW